MAAILLLLFASLPFLLPILLVLFLPLLFFTRKSATFHYHYSSRKPEDGNPCQSGDDCEME